MEHITVAHSGQSGHAPEILEVAGPSAAAAKVAPASTVTAADRAAARANEAADEAMAHAEHLRPGGTHNFWAKGLQGKGQLDAVTFGLPKGKSAGAEFVRRLDGKGNLYISANEVRHDLGATRGGEEDLVSISVLHTDMDPEEGVPLADAQAAIDARIKAAPATDLAGLDVSSGNGRQLYWILAEPLPATAENIRTAKAYNRGLRKLYGGDPNACNPAGLLRLAGTANIPDAGKRAKGRVTARAHIVRKSDVRVTLEQMRQFVEPVFDIETAGTTERERELIEELNREGYDDTDHFVELDRPLKDKFLQLLDARPRLRSLYRDGKPMEGSGDASRSGHVASLADALGRTGDYSVVEFARLVWTWDLPVMHEGDREGKLDARQIARAWARVAETVEVRDEAKQAELYEKLEPVPFDGDEGVGEAGNSDPPASAAKGPRIPFMSFDDVASTALSGSAPYLIKGLLDQGTLSVMYGPSNVGKSFLGLLLAFHIAIGRLFGGMRVAKGTVVYVAAEGGRGVSKRVEALRRKFGHADADLQFVLMSLDLRRADADVTPLIDALRALGRPVAFLVLDTLSRILAGGDENSSVDMGALVRNIDRIRTATGAHIMLVHHSGKDQAKGARGHSLLRAATDTEIEVGAGEVVVTKQRDLDKSWSSAFTLPVVTLGHDPDGEAITSCVLELVAKQDKPSGKATPTEQAVLDALADMLSDEPASSAKAADILECTEGSVHDFTLNGVRHHLKNLRAKGLVTKLRADQWRLNAPKTPSATWFSEIDLPEHETREVAGKVAEGVFN